MKHCPSCQSTFSDTQDFCTNDGTRLVNDDPASDLGKTLVAPPPAPQSSGTDILPTQVATTSPGYDNQPLPYAPQYQQPLYAPQGYGAPRSNRKMLYIGIASVVVIAGVVLLIVLLSGSKSLGTYKASLSDLLPEKVGAYSRTTTGTLDDVVDKGLDRDAQRFFSYDDAKAGKYENFGKKILLIASNFSSPEKARDALKKIKSEIERANNRSDAQPLDGARAIKVMFQEAQPRRP